MLPPRFRWTLRPFVAAYGAGIAAFLVLDGAWLSAMGPRLYRPAIGHLMREGFDVPAALAFYVTYVAGMLAFVVDPADRARQVLARGGFFGAVCYATYDLTNQATLSGWPWHVTLADLAWGMTVTALASVAAQRAARAAGA